jgi:peptidoglycan/xylan/chitin deacetylase (PgdA/CDA1 family)
VVVSFDDGYAAQYTIAGRMLRRLGWPGVLNLQVDRVDARGGLTSAQVRTLVRRGWELSSHTFTHPDLTRVDAARLQHEVADSRVWLQTRFGTEVAFFCYPFGRTSAAVEAAVQDAGYLGATTSAAGIASPAGDVRALPRLTVGPKDSAARLARRVNTSVAKVRGSNLVPRPR